MGIGVWQVVLVLVIVLIIFGAGKLPKVMGDVAKGVKNFKSGMAEEPEDSKKEPVTDENTATQVSESSKNEESSVKS
jgi:sec-independent protein translocase protein TatA|tara:strand:- start:300 stop:530 length:231 start_codon:yes stop_codon:yes gene_type:complete